MPRSVTARPVTSVFHLTWLSRRASEDPTYAINMSNISKEYMLRYRRVVLYLSKGGWLRVGCDKGYAETRKPKQFKRYVRRITL